MPYYKVTYTHTSFVVAADSEEAKEQVTEYIRDNVNAHQCNATKTSEKAYSDYWYRYYLD